MPPFREHVPSACLTHTQKRLSEGAAITVGVTYNDGAASARKNRRQRSLSQSSSAPGSPRDGTSGGRGNDRQQHVAAESAWKQGKLISFWKLSWKQRGRTLAADVQTERRHPGESRRVGGRHVVLQGWTPRSAEHNGAACYMQPDVTLQ